MMRIGDLNFKTVAGLRTYEPCSICITIALYTYETARIYTAMCAPSVLLLCLVCRSSEALDRRTLPICSGEPENDVFRAIGRRGRKKNFTSKNNHTRGGGGTRKAKQRVKSDCLIGTH